MPGPTDRCPLCDGPGRVRLQATDRNRELGSERFRYRRCERCGTYWLVDVPDDLGRFYIEAEQYYGLPSATELERLRAAEAHKLAFVRSHTVPGRLIEIGPGSGAFAYAARREGFEVTAVERDAQTCAHLQDVVGARAIQSEDPVAVLAGLPPARAIAMWHVLEPSRPGAGDRRGGVHPRPGGVLALSTPNPRSLQFRLRARWAHVDAPAISPWCRSRRSPVGRRRRGCGGSRQRPRMRPGSTAICSAGSTASGAGRRAGPPRVACCSPPSRSSGRCGRSSGEISEAPPTPHHLLKILE